MTVEEVSLKSAMTETRQRIIFEAQARARRHDCQYYVWRDIFGGWQCSPLILQRRKRPERLLLYEHDEKRTYVDTAGVVPLQGQEVVVITPYDEVIPPDREVSTVNVM